MTPGPILIVKPPGCELPVKLFTFASGNLFGAVSWTDGKQEAPMMPDEPWLRKSPTEGVLFWTDGCEAVGEFDPSEGKPEPPEWASLKFAVKPTEDDLFAALASGLADTEEKLRYLRTRLWWLGNDPVRRGQARRPSPAHQQNMEAILASLSDTDPAQRLQKAELLRELARFGEALPLLDQAYPDEYARTVASIRSLTLTREARVARFVR
ncbi:MAG TPA: hypothetical protein VMB21_01835 [Candidatus Limnocylindria bacterium]|jgi:hypothetical protein|nr:hypothetical protein [Candidatus Limnocylindria bacterium]